MNGDWWIKWLDSIDEPEPRRLRRHASKMLKIEFSNDDPIVLRSLRRFLKNRTGTASSAADPPCASAARGSCSTSG